MITIYHLKRDLDRDTRLTVTLPPPGDASAQIDAARAAFKAGHYEAVATVDTDDLNLAFKLTQNGVVSPSWTMEPPEGLTPLVQPIKHNGKLYGHRSTDIGDILMLDNALHMVAPFGFERIGG